eukprot:13760562-Alexandrium_andersonii.AAC.1
MAQLDAASRSGRAVPIVRRNPKRGHTRELTPEAKTAARLVAALCSHIAQRHAQICRLGPLPARWRAFQRLEQPRG